MLFLIPGAAERTCCLSCTCIQKNKTALLLLSVFLTGVRNNIYKTIYIKTIIFAKTGSGHDKHEKKLIQKA